MGTPLKISDPLFALAKQEAQLAERSITAQIEHWAKIGRAVELVLAHQELLTLKKAGELIASAFPSSARREEVQQILFQLAASGDRERAKAAILAPGKALYESDPTSPGLLIQIAPDGTRTRGRLVGRRFVPGDL